MLLYIFINWGVFFYHKPRFIMLETSNDFINRKKKFHVKFNNMHMSYLVKKQILFKINDYCVLFIYEYSAEKTPFTMMVNINRLFKGLFHHLSASLTSFYLNQKNNANVNLRKRNIIISTFFSSLISKLRYRLLACPFDRLYQRVHWKHFN